MSLIRRIIEFLKSLFSKKETEEDRARAALADYKEKVLEIRQAAEQAAKTTQESAERLRKVETQMELLLHEAKKQVTLGQDAAARRCLSERKGLEKQAELLRETLEMNRKASDQVNRTYQEALAAYERYAQRVEQAASAKARAEAELHNSQQAASGTYGEDPFSALEEEAIFKQDVAQAMKELNDPIAALSKKYEDAEYSSSAFFGTDAEVEKELESLHGAVSGEMR